MKAFDRKSKLLAQLKNEEEAGLKTLSELRRTHPELETTLNTGFFERKGSLKPPVDGQLEETYGAMVDKTYWYRLLRKGWAYRAHYEPVKSVFNGEVAFAGKLPGYGSTIVVDHGDHYYSVYGWMDSLRVSLGGKVREGDIIGRSDQKLYFEIRHFWRRLTPLDGSKMLKQEDRCNESPQRDRLIRQFRVLRGIGRRNGSRQRRES